MNISSKYIFDSTLYILVKCPIKFYGTLNDACEWRNNPVFGRCQPVYATTYLRRNDLSCIIYRMYHFSFLLYSLLQNIFIPKGWKIVFVLNRQQFCKKKRFMKNVKCILYIVVGFVASTQLQMDCKILINRD